MALKFNPFGVYAINQYSQYKDCPFLESHSTTMIKNTILGQIRDNFTNPERLLLLGEKGLGKTTTLFFVKDILEQHGYKNVFFLSKLILDNQCLHDLTGKYLSNFSNEKVFLLIDFQDTLNTPNLKKFLEFIWDMMTSPYYKNINLIFSLNISHYNYALTISEVLGKFDNKRIERMTFEETKDLILSRLALAGDNNFFDEETIECIYEYSKGIPRNVICASRTLTDNFFSENKITIHHARGILREVYTDKIINDRVEDTSMRPIYKGILQILSKDFGGKADSQEILVKKVKEQLNIGRNKLFNLIEDLEKFGVINVRLGGERNNKKIITTI